MSNSIKIAGAALLVYIVAAFTVPKLFDFSGSRYWILVGGLVTIGVAAVGAYIWFEMRNAAEGKPKGAGAADELSQLLHEAEERLRSSQLGKGARFGSLPLVFVIGPPGSTKTTAMVQSGLEPELLSGQVYQADNAIAPTRFINAWFARQWIFVEAGQAALTDPNQWSRLIRRMRPGTMQSSERKGALSPRAVVVCVNCEEFLKSRASEAQAAAARDLHDKLGEISKGMGISLPVYVLFSKADRIPFFLDYFGTMTNEESPQVLGATLPAGVAQGAYDQEQSTRLNAAFDQLYFSLAGHRPDFLGRENDAERLPGTYEFPRELRKLRTPIVQFLLDLCRPSQLTAAPFLRGFYFSGVRPVLVREAASAPVASSSRDLQHQSGATGIFRVGREAAGARMVSEGSSTRKVPQWVFLRQFFAQVLLADEAALGASAVSTKGNTLRRVLWATAAALGLLLCILWVTSYLQNRGLETDARDAAAGLGADPRPSGSGPSLDDLTRLETLRQSVETIGRYNRDGAPLSYRWGLYIGDDLYPKVRRVYFRRFSLLLFASTQASLLSSLQALPPNPSPSDSYQFTYDTLKSYLITTSNHDKSTRAYLSPLLYSRWETGKGVDAARAQLARKQFDFYADELKYANPYPSENNAAAIDHGRKYLAQFAGTERVYRFMLAEANKTAPSLNFNQKFPGSAQTVINSRDVLGAFTKAGWPLIQDSIKHVDRFFAGEQWVLGDQSGNLGDRAKLEDDLRKLYSNDYLDQWRDYLKKSVVVGYSSIQDAAKKLAVTSSPQSPLLAMFCMASQNVGVDPEIVKSFKPLLTVVPASCGDQYIGGPNQDYMKALLALQVALGQISNPDPNDPNVAAAATNANAARVATGQLAQGFGVDPLAPTVQKLIEDPIANVEPLVKGLGAAALNKGGKNLCAEFRGLMNKYPFNAQSTTEASLADVNGIFKPVEGSLWKFYDQNLQKLLPKQGTTYAPAPAGGVTLQPGFINFFNRMAAFSNTLYAGSGDPHFTYSLKPVQSEGIQSVTLNIDGQSLTYSGGSAAAKQLVWPGNPPGIVAKAKFGGPDITWATHQGLWGVFRFFGRAEKPVSAATSSLEWVIRIGDQPAQLPNGKPLTVRFDLDMGTSPPVFQKGYLSGLTCVADVAK